MNTGTLISYGKKISRDDLALIPTPDATRTHQPIPHHKIVQSLIETLSFRHIGVLKDEYAVSGNGMKMFGVLDLETGFEGCRFSIGIRNSHDKSFRLAVTAGLQSHCLRKHDVQRRLHASAGKALEELLTAGLPLHRCGPACSGTSSP